ncbi:MAG: VCBS repeat-containing protein [Acidobacteriota bacterium]
MHSKRSFGIVVLTLSLALLTAGQALRHSSCDQITKGNIAIPAGLAPLVLQYYPPIEKASWSKYFPPSIFPQLISDGSLQCFEHQLSPAGPDVYIVTYCGVGGVTEFRIFQKDSSGNFSYLWGADPDTADGDAWDPKFVDLDGDGTDEILMYYTTDLGAHEQQSGVYGLAYRNGTIVPITPVEDDPFMPGGHYIWSTVCSSEGVGFVPVGNGGPPELVVYPDVEQWPQDPAATPKLRADSRTYVMVNGYYVLQPTPPSGITAPVAIGAAIKPASIPLGELQGAGGNTSVKGKSQGGGNDQAITLYVMPPSGFTLDDVDWTSLRIADFTQAPTADEGVDPAPYSASAPPATMMPVSRFGQTMLQEDLSKPDMSFTQKDKDPVYYIGPSGELHFTTPYHIFGFSKTALLPWLYAQWQNGASSSPLTTCVSPGQSSSSAKNGGTKAGSQTPPASKAAPAKPAGTKGPATKAQPESQGNPHCFAPITIPIRVNLTNNRGPALGEARIWIDTGAQGSSSAAADAGGTKQLTGRKARADSAK